MGTEPSLTTGMGTDIVSTEKTAADATASSTVVAGIDLGDEQLAAVVRGGLSDVEELLVSELSDGEDFLTEAALHLARAGGKRFRPLFTILTAQLGPVPNDPSIITAATVTELVHLATLYHDDVMDEASMRRGAPSANAAGETVWRSWPATICSRTHHDWCRRSDPRPFGSSPKHSPNWSPADARDDRRQEGAGSGRALPQGRVGEDRFADRCFGTLRRHLLRRRRSSHRAPRALGDAVGTAFQISDDIIDISSVSAQSGKTPGTDLREGVHTLPVLYAFREEGADADRLRELLAGPVTEDAWWKRPSNCSSVRRAWSRRRQSSASMPSRRKLSC